jgi:hypothetical protein
VVLTIGSTSALSHLETSTEGIRNYGFIHCINLYKEAYLNYHQRFCRGKKLKARTEALLTKVRSSPTGKSLPIGELRKKIKLALADERQAFANYRRVFFMIDLYPENEKRFPIGFEDIVTDNN